MGLVASCQLSAQRTVKRADKRVFFLALTMPIGPSEIYSDMRVVVLDLRSGEVNCVGANHLDADLWIKVWNRINELVVKKISFWAASSEGTHYRQGQRASDAGK